MKRSTLIAVTVLFAAFFALPAMATTGKTLDNLQAAYNGESNANAKYLEYAKKAEQEGYLGIAPLFRAAARAEEIHANNHAEVIKNLGATPKKTIELPPILTTAENLKDAVKGETYERDVMYPDFIKVAKAEKNSSAIWTFEMALGAEAEHAKLYTQAGENQESMKTATDFYVCSVCGHTVTKIDFSRCPACKNPKEKFEKIA